MILRNRRNSLGGKVKHGSTGVDEALPLGMIKRTEAGGEWLARRALRTAMDESPMPPRERRCPGCLAGSLRCAVQALLCYALEPCQEQQFWALQFKNLWENARGG